MLAQQNRAPSATRTQPPRATSRTLVEADETATSASHASVAVPPPALPTARCDGNAATALRTVTV